LTASSVFGRLFAKKQTYLSCRLFTFCFSLKNDEEQEQKRKNILPQAFQRHGFEVFFFLKLRLYSEKLHDLALKFAPSTYSFYTCSAIVPSRCGVGYINNHS
jgi:hypothetical protein